MDGKLVVIFQNQGLRTWLKMVPRVVNNVDLDCLSCFFVFPGINVVANG